MGFDTVTRSLPAWLSRKMERECKVMRSLLPAGTLRPELDLSSIGIDTE